MASTPTHTHPKQLAQKRVNKAGLRLFSRKTYVQGWPLAGIKGCMFWELGFRVLTTLTDKKKKKIWPTMPKLFAQIMWYVLNTCFSESEIWVHSKQRVSIHVTLNKNPGPCVSNELLWWTVFHMCCHNSWLGELSISCVIPVGEDSRLCALWNFSFCWFCFVALCCNKSQPWIHLYADSWKS